MSQYNVTYVRKPLINDFLNSSQSVLLVESCANGLYGSTMHLRLSRIFKSYAKARHTAQERGTIRTTSVGRNRFVIDMYLTENATQRGKIHAESLYRCLDSVLAHCKENFIDPSNILIGRMMGGKHKVPLSDLVTCMDDWCEKNRTSLRMHVDGNEI